MQKFDWEDRSEELEEEVANLMSERDELKMNLSQNMQSLPGEGQPDDQVELDALRAQLQQSQDLPVDRVRPHQLQRWRRR